MTDENGKPKYSQADIRRIAESKTAAPAKVIAARRTLSAMRDGGKFLLDRQGKAHPGGTDPEPGKDFDRICDRTEGKPRIRMEVEHSQRARRRSSIGCERSSKATRSWPRSFSPAPASSPRSLHCPLVLSQSPTRHRTGIRAAPKAPEGTSRHIRPCVGTSGHVERGPASTVGLVEGALQIVRDLTLDAAIMGSHSGPTPKEPQATREASHGLITIDPETGDWTDVNPFVGADVEVQSIAFAPDGTLYGVKGDLFTIDTTTGEATAIGSVGLDVRGLAWVPSPGSAVILVGGALSGIRRKRRR